MSLIVTRVKESPYFADNFSEIEKKALGEVGFTYQANDLNPDILITNTQTTMQELERFNLNHIKLMIHPNSGFDNFTVDFALEAHFPIVLGNPLRQSAVVEYIVSEIFARNRQKEQKVWNRNKREVSRKLLKDQKALIFGFGHIGKDLFKKIKSIFNEVDVVDPYIDGCLKEVKDFSKYHFILMACSLNQKNVRMINKSTFNEFREDACLINAARGELVCFEDLLKFLKENPLSLACLDVFEKEPFEINKFLNCENLRMTSHIAGCHDGLDLEIIQFEKGVLKDFLKGDAQFFQEKYEDLLLQNKIRNGEFI